MKFLVIRKVRTGTGMQPTAQMIRAHKEVVLVLLSAGRPTAPTPFWVVAASAFKTPIPHKS
jgi:hypothetical protein